MDINRKPQHDVPMWSETRWAGCFNPREGVGLFLHAGRLRGNVEWWWAQTAIYLPGGRVAVDRSWVRSPEERGVKTPTLEHRVEEGGWMASFDGIVEVATSEALGKSPWGSGMPSIHAQFEVTADNSLLWWDMQALNRVGKQDFADMHVESMGRCTGTLRVGSEHYRLDGHTYYDHSAGVRDFTHFHSHYSANIAMPDYTLIVICIYAADGKPRPPIGVWCTKDGKQLRIERAEMPRLNDVFGTPQTFDWVVKAEGMAEQTFRVEVKHNFPMTLTFENDNINGIAWNAPGDPLFLTECEVKVTAADGSVGFGHNERSNRRSTFVSPSNA